MITIIHGEDATESRNYFYQLKEKTKDAITLEGASITLTDLQQALSGEDLFGESKTIFIENLISKRKSQKEIESVVSLLITHNSSSVTLWEGKELTKKQLQELKSATIKQFDIPTTIFAFLDAFHPKNVKQLISLFHKTLEDKDAEFVFFMLQRQMRTLLALKGQVPVFTRSEMTKQSNIHNSHPEKSHPRGEYQSGENYTSGMDMTISELSRLAPWQKSKLEKQASLFTLEKLLQLHSQIFTIEHSLKTGGLSQPLADTLDLLLLSV